MYAPAFEVPVALPGPPLGPIFKTPLLVSESNIIVDVVKSNTSAPILNSPEINLIKLSPSFTRLKSPLPLKSIPVLPNTVGGEEPIDSLPPFAVPKSSVEVSTLSVSVLISNVSSPNVI